MTIVTRPATQEYLDNWSRTFAKNPPKKVSVLEPEPAPKKTKAKKPGKRK